jgi:hypothetical protein
VPDSVTAQVFDPDNNLVPSEVALNSEGTSATVHFTPKVVGRHHLLVAFAPVGIIQQVGVYVGRPWSGAQSPVLLPVPRCAQVDRTTRGTWLCDGIALRELTGRQVKLYSGSVLPDVAVSGNVVWVVGEGRVRRFVDNGTELELTGSLLLSQTAPLRIIQSRLASEQELWVLDDQLLHRFVFTDAGVLAATPAARWTAGRRLPFALDAVSGLLVRVAPDRVLVAQVEETRPVDTLLCPFRLGPDGSFSATAETCQRVPGMPVGYEEGVLWTRVLDGGQVLHRWGASEGWLAERGTLAFDLSVSALAEPLRAGFCLPIIRMISGNLPAAAAPVALTSASGQPTLGMELLPGMSPSGFNTLGPRFYFFWMNDSASSGGTLVFNRSAP